MCVAPSGFKRASVREVNLTDSQKSPGASEVPARFAIGPPTKDGLVTADERRDRTRLRAVLVRACVAIPAVMLVVSGAQIAPRLIISDMRLNSNIATAYHATFMLSQDDSWIPMLQARQYLAANPGKDVYQAMFFDHGVKFQYPLTSLLFIEWLRAVTVPALPLLI